MAREVEMPGAEFGDLLDPGAGVVEEQQQGPVAQGEATVAGKAPEQLLHLVALEEVRLGGCGSLHGDGRDALADLEHLRLPAGDVVEQGVQGRQALVAGPDVVAALVLQVAEEPEDPFEAEVCNGELGDLRSLVLGDVAQQQPDGVPIAAHRGRAQPLHRDQMVEEERVDQRPERLLAGHGVAGHGVPADQAGRAKVSNRWLASASSCGVIVR